MFVTAGNISDGLWEGAEKNLRKQLQNIWEVKRVTGIELGTILEESQGISMKSGT